MQRRPPRFKPEAFLEALFDAYAVLVAKGQKDLAEGPTIRLVDVYELLTLLPGQSREYSRQEFGRDLFLLDQSGVTTTRKGYVVSFPASTGTRTPSSALRVVTDQGEEKLYYGLAFHAG